MTFCSGQIYRNQFYRQNLWPNDWLQLWQLKPEAKGTIHLRCRQIFTKILNSSSWKHVHATTFCSEQIYQSHNCRPNLWPNDLLKLCQLKQAAKERKYLASAKYFDYFGGYLHLRILLTYHLGSMSMYKTFALSRPRIYWIHLWPNIWLNPKLTVKTKKLWVRLNSLAFSRSLHVRTF